jgi:hypothetical protein
MRTTPMSRVTAYVASALIAGLALCTAATAHAEGARHYITGVVIDRNGEPISRAIVSLSPGSVELVTDADGRFVIDYLRDDAGERTRLAKRTDYALDVWKPGFHAEARSFYYKKGAIQLDDIVVVQDSIAIDGDGQDLDPTLYDDRAQSDGATYEGQ